MHPYNPRLARNLVNNLGRWTGQGQAAADVPEDVIDVAVCHLVVIVPAPAYDCALRPASRRQNSPCWGWVPLKAGPGHKNYRMVCSLFYSGLYVPGCSQVRKNRTYSYVNLATNTHRTAITTGNPREKQLRSRYNKLQCPRHEVATVAPGLLG